MEDQDEYRKNKRPYRSNYFHYFNACNATIINDKRFRNSDNSDNSNTFPNLSNGCIKIYEDQEKALSIFHRVDKSLLFSNIENSSKSKEKSKERLKQKEECNRLLKKKEIHLSKKKKLNIIK